MPLCQNQLHEKSDKPGDCIPCRRNSNAASTRKKRGGMKLGRHTCHSCGRTVGLNPSDGAIHFHLNHQSKPCSGVGRYP